MRLYLSSFRNGNRPDALLQLLRGERKTGVILNASDAQSPGDRAAAVAEELARLEGIGLEPEEIDLRDWFDDGRTVASRLASYPLIWVRGGNTFVLRRAFRYSGADAAIPALLQDDSIVYGGYSAGVCVLAPSLRGLELVDHPHEVPEGYEPEVIWDGLGVLPYAVAPHYRSDHFESEAVEGVVQHFTETHTPFVALRDGQAIVIDGSQRRVVW